MSNLNTSLCLICGQSLDIKCEKSGHLRTVHTKPLFATISTMNPRNHSIFLQWRNQCSKTICEILLGSATVPVCDIFKNANYCVGCEQVMRDIHFTYKQLKSFQSKLDQLSKSVRRKLHSNFVTLNNQKNIDKENTDNDIFTSAGSDSCWNSKSYREIVEIIHQGSLNFSPSLWDFLLTEKYLSQDELVNEKISLSDSNPYGLLNLNVEDGSMKQEAPDDGIENDDDNCFDDSTSALDWNSPVQQETAEINKNSNQKQRADSRTKIKRKGILPSTQLALSNRMRKKTTRTKEKSTHTVIANKKSSDRKRSRKSEDNKLLNCTEKDCQLKFMKQTTLDVHIRQFHKGETRIHPCSRCSKSFKWRKTLLQHIRDFHEGPRSSLNYFCKYCAKAYSSDEELNSHYEVSHLGSNPFSCAFCTSLFSNSVDLRTHMKEVHTEPDIYKFKCEVCNKPFSTKSGWRKHVRLHGNPDLLHKCHICPQMFASKCWLKAHLERHNESFDHVCEVCGKAFRNTMDLKAHSIWHTEDRRFKCNICGKGFFTVNAVTRHETSHSGIKAFMCQSCGKSFISSFNLKEHQLKVCTDNPPVSTRKKKKK